MIGTTRAHWLQSLRDNNDNFDPTPVITRNEQRLAGNGTPMPQGPKNAFITTQTFNGTTSTFS